jgi:hypothetical protein
MLFLISHFYLANCLSWQGGFLREKGKLHLCEASVMSNGMPLELYAVYVSVSIVKGTDFDIAFAM